MYMVYVYMASRQVQKQTMKIPEEDWLYTLVKDVNIPQSLQVVNRRMKLNTHTTNKGNIHCGPETIIV